MTKCTFVLHSLCYPTGAADLASASIQAGNGDWDGAIISGLEILPFVGDIGKTAKIPRHLKTIRKAIDAVKDGDNAKATKGLTATKAENLADARKKGIQTVNRVHPESQKFILFRRQIISKPRMQPGIIQSLTRNR